MNAFRDTLVIPNLHDIYLCLDACILLERTREKNQEEFAGVFQL